MVRMGRGDAGVTTPQAPLRLAPLRLAPLRLAPHAPAAATPRRCHPSFAGCVPSRVAPAEDVLRTWRSSPLRPRKGPASPGG